MKSNMGHRTIYLLVSTDENGEIYNVIKAYTTRSSAETAQKTLEKRAKDSSMIYSIETVLLHYK